MSAQQSLADAAVEALAAVRAIGHGMDNEHPMRHAVWSLKRTAEQVLSDAMNMANVLSHQAKMIVLDHEDAIKEMKK